MSANFPMVSENCSQLQRLAIEVEMRLQFELEDNFENLSVAHGTYPAETVIPIIQFKVARLVSFKSPPNTLTSRNTNN